MGSFQMLFLCVIMALFTESSSQNPGACASQRDCIFRYLTANWTIARRLDLCCFDYDPPRCIRTYDYCSDTSPTPYLEAATLRYEEPATSWSPDDGYKSNYDNDNYDDDENSPTTTVIVSIILGIMFLFGMFLLVFGASRKKNPQQNRGTGEGARTYGGRIHQEEMERLQQRERAEQFSRFVDTGSRACPEDDMMLLAPLTPTAPDLRETSRHSSSNLPTNTAAASSHAVNLLSQSHPGPFGDAPPSYVDVTGTDVSIPECPPPKYEDVV